MLTTHVKTSLLLLLAVLVGGTLGYTVIEGWNILDSFYMTVITLSTVGYGELRPLSNLGRLFTSMLILVGVATVAYTAARSMEALIEQRLFHWRRMNREIRRMQGHFIVCGFGRMGEIVVTQLMARGIPTVVVERDPETCDLLDRRDVPHVRGDATDDAVLVEAGVRNARSLATVLPSDADNLFITLSARVLSRDLTIVSRASQEKSEAKMVSAGANRVLNPYRSGGQRMVQQLLHPTVTEFMDELASGSDLHIDEVRLAEGSPLVGRTLREAPIRRELDIMVVGLRRHGGEMTFNPPPDIAPQTGDVLVVLGRTENLRRLETLAAAGGGGGGSQ